MILRRDKYELKLKQNDNFLKEKILEDYFLAIQSRESGLLGRKEVFMGKAKFGIFGDGKNCSNSFIKNVQRGIGDQANIKSNIM